MKLFYLIILIQFVAFTINCDNLEDLMDGNSLEGINNRSMQANVDQEDSSLINEKTKRKILFGKRLNNEINKKKKFRPIVYDGYSLDINIDMFKSTVMNRSN
jgi:hypothetical protein